MKILKENSLLLLNFAEQYVGQTIPKEVLANLYSEYNSEEVTNSTMKIISGFVMNRGKMDNV